MLSGNAAKSISSGITTHPDLKETFESIESLLNSNKYFFLHFIVSLGYKIVDSRRNIEYVKTMLSFFMAMKNLSF